VIGVRGGTHGIFPPGQAGPRWRGLHGIAGGQFSAIGASPRAGSGG
jgi:hypothetical protein